MILLMLSLLNDEPQQRIYTEYGFEKQPLFELQVQLERGQTYSSGLKQLIVGCTQFWKNERMTMDQALASIKSLSH